MAQAAGVLCWVRLDRSTHRVGLVKQAGLSINASRATGNPVEWVGIDDESDQVK